MRDELTEYEKTWKPQMVRLDIPLRSVVNLRRVAGELRALAERFDFISRSGWDATEALNEAWFAASHTRRNLINIRTVGRPPKKRIHSTRWLR